MREKQMSKICDEYDEAYAIGYDSRQRGFEYTAGNPYNETSEKFHSDAWKDGYRDAAMDEDDAEIIHQEKNEVSLDS